MFDYTTLGSCVLVLTIALAFVMVILVRQQRTGKDVSVWLMSGVVGVMLGAGAGAAGIQLAGYELRRSASTEPIINMSADGQGTTGNGAESQDAADPANAGGMGAMSGMGGMGMGGGRGPSAKRQLTTLVRKLDLLTGDLNLKLDAEQQAAIVEIVSRAEARETMNDEDAQSLYDELMTVFNEAQTAIAESVSLPFRRGGGGGGGGGGGPPDENANPFADEPNAVAVQSLVGRFSQTSSGAEAVANDVADPNSSVPEKQIEIGGEKEPATKEPATKEPATKEPATKEPATKEPATEEPATEEAASETSEVSPASSD